MARRKRVHAEQVTLGDDVETLIRTRARDISARMIETAQWAKSEEDVRYECNKLIDEFIDEAGLGIKGRHEFGLAGGRIDSKYSFVIIEYKSPRGAGRITESENASGTRAAEEQLRQRFIDFQTHGDEASDRIFGVATDGDTFLFGQERDGVVEVEAPVPVTPFTVERVLRALVAIGARGRPFLAENLADDFGAKSEIGREGVASLYRSLVVLKSPRALMLFDQWKLLFGEVCGYDVTETNDKFQELGRSYGVGADARPAELLFALQTYYAVFMKLLASEIVLPLAPISGSMITACVRSTDSVALHRNLSRLEEGGTWTALGLRNFLEGDLFSWYLDAWDEDLSLHVMRLVRALDAYDPSTLSVDPSASRDLLKELYHELFPRSVRHALGEYYTPDWLADHVINETGFVGESGTRVLDPACGSGTFLVLCINRIRRQWAESDQAREVGGRQQLLASILNSVVGFDLNPLAVMASRTNVLLAIRDLLEPGSDVSLPVYLADAVNVPDVTTQLVAVADDRDLPIRFPTAAGALSVPADVAQSLESLDGFVQVLERAVFGGYAPNDYLTSLASHGVAIRDRQTHTDLLTQLQELHAQGRDGIWARIIKNALAPRLVGTFDFVVGNPPWVFWNNLPDEYRESLRVLMTERYQLMSSRMSSMERLGATGKDISMLFVYACADLYLRDGGQLGFLITQTVFQTVAGNEFRRFRVSDDVALKVKSVEDWVQVEPFRPHAGNKTAALYIEKGAETTYPVPYIRWTAHSTFNRGSADLAEALAACDRTSEWAQPANPNDLGSFWMTSSSGVLRESSGPSLELHPRLGVSTKLESAFRVKIVAPGAHGTVVVQNDNTRAKKPLPVHEAAVEVDLVFPYLTGASIRKWVPEYGGFYLVPHTPETGMRPIDESAMRTRFPLTYSYFSTFRDELADRSLHKRWGSGNPFYSMYNIGDYSFAPFKVVWKRSTSSFAAAVAGTVTIEGIGERLLMPTESTMMIPFDSEDDAYFVAAQLNSSEARELLGNAITSSAHANIISVVPLVPFDSDSAGHVEIVRLAHDITDGVRAEQPVGALEQALDVAVTTLWHTT